MKKDFRLGVEQLDQKILLSSNPWYIDAIKASEVWTEVASSVSKPVVAIVDSGIDLNHSALIPNLFKNPLDPVDGKDNDNNGCVDDISGWDFVQNDVGSGLLNLSTSFGILKTLPVQPIVTPPPPPVVVAPKLMYNISVSGRSIKGWANLNTGTTKPVVKVYVNNVLRHSVAANIYRTDTRKNNGFSVTMERRFLNLRSNMVVVKIVDNTNNLSETVYRGYMKR